MERATKRLPELPELENVEIRDWVTVFIMGYIFCMMAPTWFLIPWLYMKYRHWLLEDMGPVATAVIALFAGLMAFIAVYLLLKIFTTAFYWSTNESGLTLRNLLGSTRIGWTEVREANMRELTFGTKILTLRTNDRTFSIPFTNGRLNMPVLLASVRQHLARCGKVDNLSLSNEAVTLWYQIPDELPDQLEWNGKTAWDDIIGMPVMLMLLLALTAYLFTSGDRFPAVLMLCCLVPFSLLVRITVQHSIITPKRIAISGHGVDVDGLQGSASIPWSDVKEAHWYHYGSRNSLKITAGVRRILVPLYATDEHSAQCVLALIRGLRTHCNIALSIPHELCAPPVDGHDTAAGLTAGKIEMRVDKSFIRLMSVMVVVFIGVILLVPLLNQRVMRSDDIGMLVVIPSLFVLCRAAVKSYAVTVDENGVSKHCLCWRKTVMWSDVESIVASKYGRSESHRPLLLKDARGKTLMEVGFTYGVPADRDRLISYIQTKLAHLLSDFDQPKPWKARPYSEQGATDADQNH